MPKKNLTGVAKKKLWLQKRLKLKCPKPKYFNYKMIVNCKNCIKGYKYNISKALKNYSFFNYLKIQKCNLYINQKSIYKYITKKYYTTCLIKKKYIYI